MLALSFFAACKNDNKTNTVKDVVAANVDTSVSPADNFFDFATATGESTPTNLQ